MKKMRTQVQFDAYDAECLAFLADHFDKHGAYVETKDFPRYAEVGDEVVQKLTARFSRYQLIKRETRDSVQVLPQLLEVVDQLRTADDGNEDKKENENRYDLFISYASSDSALAHELRTEIEKRGLTTFMAEKDIPVSAQWKLTIRDALRSSNRVLILLTPNSLSRPWVLLETGAAWVLDKTLIPAFIHVDPNSFPDPLKDVQARKIETMAQRKLLVDELAPATCRTSSVHDAVH